ncbi:MAG: hypothetical protein QG671_817 [Actinomycetota bacterium]|nr:hypothetical protein [Actinomycetota bacterium]HQZ84727.1 DUF805 domain-containing protein [Actinomycetota bacterium]
MGFGEAISTCFKKYVTFSGRARRSEFWWFMLFVWIVAVVAALVDNLLGLTMGGDTSTTELSNGATITTYTSSVGILTSLWWLATLLPILAVAARRLHDRGATAWWLLLYFLCCIGPIIMLFVWWIQPSQPGDNQYGPDPSAPVGAV